VPLFPALLIVLLTAVITKLAAGCFIMVLTGGVCGNSKICVDRSRHIPFGLRAFVHGIPILAEETG
jgi:hypothetical protein